MSIVYDVYQAVLYSPAQQVEEVNWPHDSYDKFSAPTFGFGAWNTQKHRLPHLAFWVLLREPSQGVRFGHYQLPPPKVAKLPTTIFGRQEPLKVDNLARSHQTWQPCSG